MCFYLLVYVFDIAFGWNLGVTLLDGFGCDWFVSGLFARVTPVYNVLLLFTCLFYLFRVRGTLGDFGVLGLCCD